MYELVNIFSIFLPQLLLYPNPKDPLNSEAARLLINDEKAYNSKVKDYVARFACSHKTGKDKFKDPNASEKSKVVSDSKNTVGALKVSP
jgi:ubiquitin-conjugating enzyme E2 H